MINVCVCHKHIINRCCIYRNILIFVDVCPLLHTTVHQNMFFSDLQIMTTTCYLMRCTNKFYPHRKTPFYIVFLFLICSYVIRIKSYSSIFIRCYLPTYLYKFHSYYIPVQRSKFISCYTKNYLSAFYLFFLIHQTDYFSSSCPCR